MNGGSTFRVGLIQMRSGRTPQANMDAAAKLISEAKTGGADYVQTPEMTNIMEVNREKLLASIVAEEVDTSLAMFRELSVQGRTIVLVTHDQSIAGQANRRIEIRDGKITRDVQTGHEPEPLPLSTLNPAPINPQLSPLN